MSDRKKEIILKTLIVIGIGSLTALLLMIPLCMIVDTSVEKNFEVTVTIGYIEMGLMMASGILLLILQFVWGGLKQKPVAAERLTSPYQSYEAVVNHIISNLATAPMFLI
ncbi:MAG: hypothetical protein GXW99_07915 [Clostridiales bacterium]|nr:hypothetical protein [Clostridiales bacterium]